MDRRACRASGVILLLALATPVVAPHDQAPVQRAGAPLPAESKAPGTGNERVSGRAGYSDDTFSIPPRARIKTVRGRVGLKPYNLTGEASAGRLVLDLRTAEFTLSNSHNENPTPARPCSEGDRPTNHRPLNIFSTPDVTILGGLIRGSVPQGADWKSTYCNSAAVNFWDAPNGIVDGVRVSRAWDGIRFGRNSGDFLIKNSWLSDVRDDAIENDYLHNGRIEDTLIDATLQGISLRPNASSRIGPSRGLVEISASLVRLIEHHSNGRASLGSLVKNDPRAPMLRMTNSVLALESHETMRWSKSWEVTWGKLSGGSNNLVLWLSDRPIPAGWTVPDARFRLLTGVRARAAWAAAVQNWIDCHPKVSRLPGDRRSDFSRCRRDTWGGFTR